MPEPEADAITGADAGAGVPPLVAAATGGRSPDCELPL